MTAAVQELIHTFEGLTTEEQQEAAALILRRSTQFDLPSISDEEFVFSAEQVFLELDQHEATNE
jgi:hypothetical protein